MMYPNPNYLKFFPDAVERTNRSSCLRVGAFLIIRKIVKEYKLDEMIKEIIGRDSGLFQDLAVYSIISEDNEGQYYPDYAYNHPLKVVRLRILKLLNLGILKTVRINQ